MFTFADLFAGIGGFRLAAEQLGGTCVFTAEIKKSALAVYSHNFGETPAIDLSQPLESNLTKPDIVCAGWPCQSFSQAGFQKGFHDETRGNLFFHLINYLDQVGSSFVLLENVRHLLKHDNGRTLDVVVSQLQDLGYRVFYKIMSASDFGLPQHRPRIYFVGIKTEMDICFEWPRPTGLIYTMHEVMRGLCNKEIGYTLREGGYNSPVGDRHNWNGYIVDGRERRLTFAEAKLMQGFPKNFYLPPPMADSTGVKLLGNAVPINVVKAILTQILIWKERFQSYGS